MHKILLKNVNAVLPDRVLDHACVLVQGCRIQEVTDQDLTGRYPEAQIVDGKGGYLLPGFIDIHSDNIETVIQPRPQSMIDFELAIDPVEAVRCAVRTGGKAVLAHPGQYGNFRMLPELVEAGLWDIEVWHPKHSTELVDHCLKLAEEYQLACTGGSDFHGRYGEGETLGCCTAHKTDLHPL